MKVRVPLEDESGSRIGYKKLENGNYEVGVIRGNELLIFELPSEVWEHIKSRGYMELKCNRRPGLAQR